LNLQPPNLHIETPLLESRALTLIAGRSIWLKMDALQPSGSFKIRGIGLACSEYARRGARRFISSSGGNAGIAVAYAARRLGLAATVVVPESSTERARHLIRQEGAEVIVHGASWQEANALAQSMIGASDAFVHPFDDPFVWEGHATLIDEVARAGLEPDAVVLSVGGGGLFCGIVKGLRRNGWGHVPIVTAETEGADSFAQAVRAGRRVSLDRITSIATSLGAKQICEEAFARSQDYPIRTAVVSDKSAVHACQRFLDDQRVLVEPACGAALALTYEASPQLAEFHKVLVIVCGGVTATVRQLDEWALKLG
jgi:L-serine/L-threonine ammonia-lyase